MSGKCSGRARTMIMEELAWSLNILSTLGVFSFTCIKQKMGGDAF